MDYIRVTAADNDLRLDRWFKRHYPNIPSSLVQKHIRKGFIRVDDKKAELDQRLSTGQVVRIHPVVLDEGTKVAAASAPTKKAAITLTDEQIEEFRELLLYQDEDIMVLNKPSGLAVQGGSKIKESVDDLLDALKFDYKERPKLVHRIDKDTSGILLLARTANIAARLTEQFRRKELEKTYWALVKGVPQPSEGTITAPLALISGRQGERMVVDEEEGQKSRTHYRVLEQVSQKLCWVEFQPHTGRKHQIRVHAADVLNTPIVSDGKYGGAEAFVEGISQRLHLHARAIEFDLDNTHYHFVAPLPPHMSKSWEILGLEEE